MSSALVGGPAVTVWTVGHSTRPLDEFLGLLEENRIAFLVDVRHFPTSRRVTWATKHSLASELPRHRIGYEHLEALGGFRKAGSSRMNAGWRNPGFRGFADYMATPSFQVGIEQLIARASAQRTAIMCAEAVPWKCHRSLISDGLVARGVRVVHILSAGKTQDHRLTPFARVHRDKVTYPAARKRA